MIQALWLGLASLFSALTCLLIAYGLRNLYRFKRQILAESTLKYFYLSAFLLLASNIWQCWLQPDSEFWYTDFQWKAACALVRTQEICVLWCETCAFVHLGWQLHSLEQESSQSEQLSTKVTNLVLISGLVVWNMSFLIYLVILTLVTEFNANQVSNQGQVVVDLVCWTVGLVSNLALISTVLYCLRKLKHLYEDELHIVKGEVNKIRLIVCVFSLSFATKSVYEWTFYYFARSQRVGDVDETEVALLLHLNNCVLPLVWDALPVAVIFRMHGLNFSGDSSQQPTPQKISIDSQMMQRQMSKLSNDTPLRSQVFNPEETQKQLKAQFLPGLYKSQKSYGDERSPSLQTDSIEVEVPPDVKLNQMLAQLYQKETLDV